MTKLRHYFSRKEWSLVALLSFLFAVASSASYLVMLSLLPQGYEFHGLSSTGMIDFLIYYQYIGQVAAGSWLIYDFFTPEWPQTGVLNPWWLLVGMLARVIQLDTVVVFHLVRLALILPLVTLVYGFFRYLMREQVAQWLATVLVLFGGGVGGWFSWLLREEQGVLIGPVDLYQAESTLFASAAFRPHFMVSWICMIAVVWLLMRWFATRRIGLMIAAAVISLFWFFFHPYYLPYMYLLMGVSAWWGVVRKDISVQEALRGLVTYVLMTLPALAYAAYLTFGDPLLSLRNAQNITLNPSPMYVLLGFGGFVIFAIPGVIRALRATKRTVIEMVMLVWVLMVPVLMYLPLQFQSRFNQGWLIPLAYFTMRTVREWRWLRTPKGIVAGSLCAALIFVSAPLALIIKDVSLFREEIIANSEVSVFYHEPDFEKMMQYLRDETPVDALIIAPPRLASYIPAVAVRRSGCCSEHETIDYETRRGELEQFFTDHTFDRDTFIRQWNPQYILDDGRGIEFSDYQLEFEVGEYRLYWVQ